MNYTCKTERASFNGTCSDDTHVLYACILVRFNLQGVPGSGKFMEQTPIGEVRFLMFPCLVYRCSGCCFCPGQEPSPRHGSLRGRMEGGRPMEPIAGGMTSGVMTQFAASVYCLYEIL